MVKFSPVAFQCGAVSTTFVQWCSSIPCKYSLGRPVVSQCTLGWSVVFQRNSCVHWASQCTMAQGTGNNSSEMLMVHRKWHFLNIILKIITVPWIPSPHLYMQVDVGAALQTYHMSEGKFKCLHYGKSHESHYWHWCFFKSACLQTV